MKKHLVSKVLLWGTGLLIAFVMIVGITIFACNNSTVGFTLSSPGPRKPPNFTTAKITTPQLPTTPAPLPAPTTPHKSS